MKHFLIFSFAVLVLFFVSCDDLQKEDKLLKKNFVIAVNTINSRAIGDSIIIDMGSITKFPWDTLYVFPSVATVNHISQTIGVPWADNENMHEDDNLFIFMYHGQVTNYLKFRGFNYQNEPYFVKFTGRFNSGQSFTHETAKFYISHFKSTPLSIDIWPAVTN